MLLDGIDLLSGSGIRTALSATHRGTSFPNNPVDGDQFELTVQNGNFHAGVYFYSESDESWIVKYPGNDVLPYDIAGSTIGTIRGGDVISRHSTVRGFKLKAGFYGCIATAGVAPVATATFTILKVGRSGAETTLGTMVFNASETHGLFVQNGGGDISITAGETILIKAPGVVDQFIADLSFTLAGTLL